MSLEHPEEKELEYENSFFVHLRATKYPIKQIAITPFPEVWIQAHVLLRLNVVVPREVGYPCSPPP